MRIRGCIWKRSRRSTFASAWISEPWAEKRTTLEYYAAELTTNKRLKQERKERKAEIRTWVSILDRSAMGRMIMELVGIQAEYSCRKGLPSFFAKLFKSDTAFAVKGLLLKQGLVPSPQNPLEVEILNRASHQVAGPLSIKIN